MFEIAMKVQHDCPYSKIAELFDLPLYEFCSELYDLMIIPKKLTEDEINLIKPIIDKPESFDIFFPGPNTNTTYVYFECMCKTGSVIVPKIKRQGGIVEYPIRYENDWEHYNIICLNKKTQAAILEFVQTIPVHEIIRIKDLGREGIFKSQFISMHQMMKSLTDRQIDVIVKAYERGYYEIPRSVKTKEIADQFNVSRAATEKSLRKAENRIMESVIPYLLVHQKIHNDGYYEAPMKL